MRHHIIYTQNPPKGNPCISSQYVIFTWPPRAETHAWHLSGNCRWYVEVTRNTDLDPISFMFKIYKQYLKMNGFPHFWFCVYIKPYWLTTLHAFLSLNMIGLRSAVLSWGQTGIQTHLPVKCSIYLLKCDLSSDLVMTDLQVFIQLYWHSAGGPIQLTKDL